MQRFDMLADEVIELKASNTAQAKELVRKHSRPEDSGGQWVRRSGAPFDKPEPSSKRSYMCTRCSYL